MELYFAHKQTTLTFEFPASVLCLSDNFIFRKYAAYIADASEEEQKITEFVKQKKKSRYIQPINKKLTIVNK